MIFQGKTQITSVSMLSGFSGISGFRSTTAYSVARQATEHFEQTGDLLEVIQNNGG